MTFRDELIEAAARAMHAHDGADEDDSTHYQFLAAAALDAMLAYRTTDECPTCMGSGVDDFPEIQCPDCGGTGRVPRDTPRLAIVERGLVDGKPTGLWMILAPDLPEGTHTP